MGDMVTTSTSAAKWWAKGFPWINRVATPLPSVDGSGAASSPLRPRAVFSGISNPTWGRWHRGAWCRSGVGNFSIEKMSFFSEIDLCALLISCMLLHVNFYASFVMDGVIWRWVWRWMWSEFYASCVQVSMRHVSCFCLAGGAVIGCIYASCVFSIFMPLCNYFYAILIV
jgi:hypothetical protein